MFGQLNELFCFFIFIETINFMLKEKATQKLIEYIRTFPRSEREMIAAQILEPFAQKKSNKKETGKQKVLNDIKSSLLEIKEAKRTGTKLKDLNTFLNEI